MTTSYTFHLRNLKEEPVEMYLFLATPEIAQKPSNVYKNSSTFLSVPRYDPSNHQTFIAKVQYTLETTQQTQPVTIGNQVISQSTKDVELNKGYIASYSSDKGGFPSISEDGTKDKSQETNLVVQTNIFDTLQNYHNALTFGLITDQGMTGVTWQPDSNVDYIITPKLTFYIAIGSYQPNTLADIVETSATNAEIKSGYNGNFDQFDNVWVTYNTNGTWTVDNKEW